MPAAKSVKSSNCPDCGASLSAGVCTACALDFLSAPAVVPTVAAKEGESDMEFGRYLLRRKLASGGMGVVYVAEDRQLKRKVALKMIRGSTFADESERARFTVESEAVAGLDHPNIVPIYEIGMIDEQPFFTMKLIDGRNLGDCLREKPATRRIARWLGQIAEAVEHAHRRGVLHRDLKPGNMLIDGDDNAWLMDFGLAKLQNEDSGLTQSSDHLGTPNYMSPELINGGAGDVSTASDVWSLGVILWEALCGEAPFRGNGPAEVMRRIAEDEPSRPPAQLDRDLLTLARRCLEKDPSRRVATAGELAQELHRWSQGEPLQVRRITHVERLWKWGRRKPALAALYIALAIGSISSLVLWQRAETAVGSLTRINDQLGQALAVSTATKLAMDARVQVAADPTLALLLAVESVEQTERREVGVLPEVVDALHAILQQVGGTDVSPCGSPIEQPGDGFIVHGYTWSMPAQYSDDGRWMLNVGHVAPQPEGIRAAIFDMHQRDRSTPSRSWVIWEKMQNSSSFCWLPERELLVAFGDGNELRSWDVSLETPEGRLIGTLEAEGYTVRSVFMKSETEEEGAEVSGIAIYDVDGDEEVDGVLRNFRIDLVSGELSVGELVSDRSIRHKETTCFTTRRLDWLFSESSELVTLSKLGSDGLPTETVRIDCDGRAHRPKFDAGGNWLVFAREEEEPVAIDLRSGSARIAAASARTLVGGGAGVSGGAISVVNSTVAIGNNDRYIRVLDLEGHKSARTLRLPKGIALGLQISPDARWVAAGGADRVVRAWQIGNRNELPPAIEFRGMSTAILDLSFTPDGQSIVAEGLGSTFRHWKFGSFGGGAEPAFLGSKTGKIIDLAASTDGRWIGSGSSDPGEVRLVDTRSGSELKFVDHAEGVTGVAFSPDDRWFASTGRDGFVRVWEMVALEKALRGDGEKPEPLHNFDISQGRLHYTRRIAFHPRGELYVTSGDGILYTWDLTVADPKSTFRELGVHSIRYLLPDVRISPDGKWLAIARHGWDSEPVKGTNQRWNMVLLFDVSQPGLPIPVAELTAEFNDTTNIDFSPDSRWLAVGGAGSGARVWDLDATEIVATKIDSDFVSQRLGGIAFSPDGKHLAAAGSDGRIHLWDWRNIHGKRTISTGRWIESLAWINGTQLVSGGDEGTIEVWETDVEKLKNTARRVASRGLTSVDRARFRIR